MSKSKKYFEGEIHYDLDYTLHTDKTTVERVKNSSGAKMVMLFRNGYWLKKYYNTSGELISERYLDLSENRSYQWNILGDAINTFDITRNDSPTTFTEAGKETILGHQCIKIAAETKIAYNGLDYTAKAEYYYSQRLKTNRNWYKDYKEGNYNEIGSEMNCIALKQNFNASYYTVYQIATKVIEREITDKEFTFDKTRLPLKEI